MPETGFADVGEHVGEWTIQTFDPALARLAVPWWDALDATEKSRECEHLDPVAEWTETNTTCINLSRLAVDHFDATQENVPVIDELALGTGSTTPQYADTSLSDEVGRVQVVSYGDEGESLRCRAYVADTAANPDGGGTHSIVEGGLLAGGLLVNHALFSNPLEKGQNVEATVTGTISFTNQS